MSYATNDTALRQALSTISVPNPRDAKTVALELIDYAAKIEDEIVATKAPIGGAADCSAPLMREAAAILANRARAASPSPKSKEQWQAEAAETLERLDTKARERRDRLGLASPKEAGLAEPVAWQVWWGLIEMQPHWPPFKSRIEAYAHASSIKSKTEVRPLYAAPLAADQNRDAYEGAREDLLDWKQRAQKAEAALKSEQETTANLVRALAEEVNGPTFMGEPVIPRALAAEPQQAVGREPLTAAQVQHLRAVAMSVFDGPETAQETRDVIEWFASMLSIRLEDGEKTNG